MGIQKTTVFLCKIYTDFSPTLQVTGVTRMDGVCVNTADTHWAPPSLAHTEATGGLRKD